MSPLTQHNINTSFRTNMKKTKEAIAIKSNKENTAKRVAFKQCKGLINQQIKYRINGNKRIAKMAIKGYKQFKHGYDIRAALREKIKLRTEKGIICDVISAFKQLLSSPFYKNESAASGAVHNTASHEHAIARILEEKGNFIRYTLAYKLNRTETLKWINNPELLKIYLMAPI